MKTPTLYIFVNKDLEMNASKAASQVAHAASRAKTSSKWGKGFSDTVIVLEASERQIRNMEKYLTERKIKTHVVIDESFEHELTAMSIDVMDRELGRVLFFGFERFYIDPYVIRTGKIDVLLGLVFGVGIGFMMFAFLQGLPHGT